MKLAPGEPLHVLLHTGGNAAMSAERPVARVAMAQGLAQLEWDSQTVSEQLALSPLLYPPEAGLHAARGRDFDGLHGFLADCLPEGWGELLMRRKLSRMGFDMGNLSALDRLALVGRQGRGALLFEPATTPEDTDNPIDLDALAEEARLILAGEEGNLADTLAALGGASGGARPKVHVGFDSNGGLSIGRGELPGDHEAWIVKFRATADPIDIGPIEMAYADMAKAAGISMSPCRLMPSNEGPGWFATRRFDRPAMHQRLHMVSLAGAIEAPPQVAGAVDYDMFLRATRAITRNEKDVEEAFRRMTFNVLAGNRDDHTRQHAYLMGEGGVWRLAPAYDLTFSRGPGGEHYLAVAGEGRDPTRAHVERVGKDHSIAQARINEIIEQAQAAIGSWDERARHWGTGSSSRKEIGDRLNAIAQTFN